MRALFGQYSCQTYILLYCAFYLLYSALILLVGVIGL